MEWWLLYLGCGAFVGFFAGLLGIGGGMTLVPLLSIAFAAQQFSSAHILHLALGTSMAAILFTSVASLRAHHAHEAVLWPVVRGIAPGIIVGTLLGTVIAGFLPTRPLSIFFTAFVYLAATQMLVGLKPKGVRELPGKGGMFTVGGVIGGISSLVAAGGAVMTVPFLTYCNVKLHQAIGTSAAVGFPIAVAGTLGYIFNGLGKNPLPEYSIGFVYLPALTGVIVASTLMAPLGAKLAHRTKVNTLKKIFAFVLYLLATKMLVSLF